MNTTTKRAAVLAAFLALEAIGLVAWSASATTANSVAAGHSFRFLLDSGNGGSCTPGSSLVDTHYMLQVGIDAAAPSCYVG